MPSYFRPSLKDRPELGVKEQFLAIDIELCKMLGVEVNPDKYVYSWVDEIGLCFVSGASVEKIKEMYAKYDDQEHAAICIKIIDWLIEHCDIECFRSPR